jgi:hypothetical protein
MAGTSPAMTENDREISDWPFVSRQRSEQSTSMRSQRESGNPDFHVEAAKSRIVSLCGDIPGQSGEEVLDKSIEC